MSTENMSLTPGLKSLRKDFRLSYMHSQGEPRLQRQIFYYLSDYYKDTLPDVPASLPRKSDWLYFDHVPRGHVNTRDVVSDVEEMAKGFMATLKGASFDSSDLPNILFNRIIKRDLNYQVSRRTVGHDFHASYFREHVLLEQTTSSEGFDAMYRTIGKLVTEPMSPFRHSEKLHLLAGDWQTNHPSQIFDPNGVLASVG